MGGLMRRTTSARLCAKNAGGGGGGGGLMHKGGRICGTLRYWFDLAIRVCY